ncbi:IS4 family transposase [Rhizobium mongolense]|uniref:IS4 family transposase n=1 Tax=Rhizobium mongolense TaxID=57676 RepID=UPI0034A18C90
MDLTVIHAVEPSPAAGRKRIEWKLLTDLEVNSCEEAVEKIKWYAMRWKIEVFHKILKSGCRAEDARLRTADRLANLVAVFCIVSWRVLWLTMLARTAPETSPSAALTEQEIEILDQMVSNAGNRQATPGSLNFYLTKLARLGGYLARTSDPPPGNTVVWRGLSRLTDIRLGTEIAATLRCGSLQDGDGRLAEEG